MRSSMNDYINQFSFIASTFYFGAYQGELPCGSYCAQIGKSARLKYV